MRLLSLSIHNYKSLREITFAPEKFTVLIGPNGAGKSNLVDSLDFVADVFRADLDVAVGHKGGVHNFWYRKRYRSKGSLVIGIRVAFEDPSELNSLYLGRESKVVFEYRLSCRTVSRALSSGVEVESENLVLSSRDSGLILEITRDEEGISYSSNKQYFKTDERARIMIQKRLDLLKMIDLESNELVLTFAGGYIPTIRKIRETIGKIRVFQVYPTESRRPGVMAASPEMDRSGSNLPAIVKYLQEKQPDVYELIFELMKIIMPDLEAIQTEYTLDKRLGLFFKEKGISRPWYSDEVSDGTIRTLSILTAIADKRTPLIVLEEPENHVHPWVLRKIYEFCESMSETKQIIVTTHSPMFLNRFSPRQVFVVSRVNHSTTIHSLLDLADADLLEGVQLGDFWEAGGIPTALPPFKGGESQ